MIKKLTKLKVADNSGVKLVQCINVKGSFGSIGDLITVSIKECKGNSKILKGQVHKSIIVRTKQNLWREDGSVLSFDDNAVVLLDSKSSIIGTRVFGPVPREVGIQGYNKILSAASFIV